MILFDIFLVDFLGSEMCIYLWTGEYIVITKNKKRAYWPDTVIAHKLAHKTYCILYVGCLSRRPQVCTRPAQPSSLLALRSSVSPSGER